MRVWAAWLWGVLGSQGGGVLVAVVVLAAGVAVPLPGGGGGRSAAAAPAQQPVERVAFRTETSRTVQNGDGSYTTSLFEQPIHFRDGQGEWRPISARIVGASGKALTDGYVFENEANRFKVAFKQVADDPGLVRFQVFGDAYEFGLDGAAAKQAQVAENRVGYRDVFPGTLLRYEVIGEGVKESLVLADALAPAAYTFTLTPPKGVGMRAVERKSGAWELYQQGSPLPVLVLGAPTVADSGGLDVADPSKSPGAPAPPAESLGPARFAEGKASLSVKERADGSFAVTLAIDKAWLSDPAREFPVLLDPSVSIPKMTIDGTFNASVPTSTPDVTSTLLSVGKDPASGAQYRAALKFDLSDILGIPAGSVTSASLSMYFLHCFPTVAYPNNNCPFVWPYYDTSVSARTMTSDWNSATTAGDAMWVPTMNGTPLSTTAFHVAYDGDQPQIWKSWSVLSAVQAWLPLGAGNYGIVLSQTAEGTSCGQTACGVRFASSEWADASFRPRLDVTWSGDGVTVYQPLSLHANGADLVWDQNPAPTGTFKRYEIHRSSTAGFTPGASTLVGTVGDRAVTRYRDTTAAPAATFSYKVVTVSTVSSVDTAYPSNEVRVSLPADLTSTKTIVSAKADFGITGSGRDCSNHGAYTYVQVDGAPDQSQNIVRSFLQFDLRDIPSSATVTSAKVSLFTFGNTATAVQLRRVAADWTEGNVTNQGSNHVCNGSGLSWNERQPGLTWASAGGDFDTSTVAASVTTGAGAHWDEFQSGTANPALLPLVQGWLNGSFANLGVVLKLPVEAYFGSVGGVWMSDDYTVTPTLRPKLELTYTDGSHAVGPAVAIASPAPAASVVGSAVAVTAAANDDGAVSQVAFYLDNNLQATDTAAPFVWTWNSTTAPRGNHQLKAVATDNAGNTSTSAVTTVNVANSAAPTVSVSATAGTAPNWNLTATAADDIGVSKVEFYADGDRLATDSSSPYAATWNTLDETNTPGWDGSRQITAKAYDADGNVTTSTVQNITVANTAGTKYKGTFSATLVPLEVRYDPAAPSQEQTPVDVTITNTSTLAWATASTKLRYRWISPDPTPVYTSSADVSIGATDLAAGGNRTIRVNVDPPVLAQGEERARYLLRFDLYDTAAPATYFAAKGNKPLDKPVTVNKVGTVGLGLERFYHYDGEELGLGADSIVNLANGNSLIRWTPLSEPGRGLSTVVDLTINSLEKKSASQAGNNVSLVISGLTRFGTPLDIHPNSADTLAGRSATWIGFVDGDGTLFKFAGATGSGGTIYYTAPAGVHLYLRQYSTTDTTKWWALTRPDRVTFFYGQDGYPTGVEDANGNRISFTLAAIGAGEDANGLAKRITQVTDAAGQGGSPAPNRSFDVSYWTKAQTPRPALRGKIKRIADHVGHALDFDYYEDGNLLRLTERGGTNADGSYLADRSLTFSYTLPDGSGPAISVPANRANPDPATSNQSTRLYGVIDARGKETTFAYITAAGTNKWKLSGRNNRAANTTTFSYPAASSTTVARPAPAGQNRASTYAFDSAGRLSTVTNPLSEITTVSWTADNMVQKVTNTSANTALGVTNRFVEYAYNQNGYLTDSWDELRNHATLAYANVAVDANDVSGKWEAGRTIPHISQLDTKIDAEGNATAGNANDYKWTFTYDSNGNLKTIKDPAGQTTGKVATNNYNADGTLASTVDQNTHTTTYNSYDANGLPTQVTDPEGNVSKAGYSDRGLLLWLQDPNHAAYTTGDPRAYRTSYDYDSFGRPGRSSQPKSTVFEPGQLVWTDSEYDANDNVVRQSSPHYGAGDGYDTSATTPAYPATKTTFDNMDRPTLVESPRSTVATPIKATTAYDEAGRVKQQTSPRGFNTTSGVDADKDFATLTSYDGHDRPVTSSQYQLTGAGAIDTTKTRATKYCYDVARDLRLTVGPNSTAASASCPSPTSSPYAFPTLAALPDHRELDYDPAHRNTSVRDAIAASAGGPAGDHGYQSQSGYNANGALTSTTNENGDTVTTSYDDRGLKQQTTEPFDTITLTNRWAYDDVGNLTKTISPRAFAIGGANASDYVETYSYDNGDRRTKTSLPAVSGTTAAATYATTLGADSPGLYWRLGETSGTSAADASGSGRTGTYNAVSLNQAGVFSGNPAAGFSTASTQYVQQSAGSNISLANQSFTVEAWAKHTGHGAQHYLLSQGVGVTNQGLHLGFRSNDQFFCAFWNNDLNTTATYPDEGWHHWACTYNATSKERRIYRDGALVAQDTAAANYQGSGNLYVGNTSTGPTAANGFPGTIDEAAVYTSTLTPDRVRAHYEAALSTPQAYLYTSYDANGNPTMTSLPTTVATVGAVTASEKTTVDYWDSGAIHASTDPTSPKVRFDYSAEGWQTLRVPETAAGSGLLEYGKLMNWDYHADGLVKEQRDLAGARASYAYDENGNRTSATEAAGVTVANTQALQVTAAFDGFDQPAYVLTPKTAGVYYGSLFTYNSKGSPLTLVANAETNASGVVTGLAGRQQTFAYDAEQRPTSQVDDNATAGSGDDETLTTSWTPTGWEATRTVVKAGPATLQKQTRTYFQNGQLKTLKTEDGTPTVLEQHTLSYRIGSVYANGNRVQDEFSLAGPDTAAPCRSAASPCTASWSYDARDRLTRESTGSNGTTGNWLLDPASNISEDETSGQQPIVYSHTGQRINTQTQGATVKKHLYDVNGNLECVVLNGWANSSCPAVITGQAPDANLVSDTIYDYKNRLAGYRAYSSGTLTDSAAYTNDPLDRPIQQTETHSGATTNTTLRYIGVANAVDQEVLTGATTTTKSYAYDAAGRKLALTDTASGSRYSYAYDPHGSISLLLNQSSTVKESYGYSAYGSPNSTISKTAAGFDNKTNPYRYTGKRFDTGSGSYDMGARRYNPATGRFLQQDLYTNALDNLDLASDPLTGNRYALTGGNPINFIETDGHRSAPVGAGEDPMACAINGHYCGEVDIGGGGDIFLEILVPGGGGKAALTKTGKFLLSKGSTLIANPVKKIFCTWFCDDLGKAAAKNLQKVIAILDNDATQYKNTINFARKTVGSNQLVLDLSKLAGGGKFLAGKPFASADGRAINFKLVDGTILSVTPSGTSASGVAIRIIGHGGKKIRNYKY